jgi:hypothetical protein
MPESSQLPVATGQRPGRPGHGPSVGTRQNNSSSGPDLRPGGESTQSGHADTHHVGWVRLAVTVAARGVLFSILGMLAWALLPTAIGWTPTTVMTGSMEPRIHPGDVVISRPAKADATTLNHILLVDDPDHAGRLRLHRFAEFAPDGNLILRGDANSANDSTPVAPAAVHGVAVLRIPFVGLPVVWIAEKNWAPLAAVLAAVAGLTLAAASGSSTAPGRPEPRQRENTLEKSRRHQQPPGAASAIRRRSRSSAGKTRTVQTFLAVAAIPVLVCGALMTASPAHAGFSAAAPNQTSSFSALDSYQCLSPARPDNPYLFYAFNEVSGALVADASANANPHDGTLNGTTTRVAGSCSPNISPALTLDGSTGSQGYVSTPQKVTAPDIFTVEIWFKTTPTTTGGKLIGFGDAQIGLSTIADRHVYMTNSGSIAFGAAPASGNSSNYTASAITSAPDMNNKNKYYNDGAWHQATATMSAAGMKLYIDGSLVNTDPGVKTGANIDGYWRIGYDTMNVHKGTWTDAPASLLFAGTIDNAAVYTAELNPVQVKAHFDAGH